MKKVKILGACWKNTRDTVLQADDTKKLMDTPEHNTGIAIFLILLFDI